MKKTFYTVNHAEVFFRVAVWSATALIATLCVSSWAFGIPPSTHQHLNMYGRHFSNGNKPSYVIAYRDNSTSNNDYGNLSNKEKRKLQDKYKKWHDLPPEEKKKLRKRMNQWRNMSPQDQKKYRNRFRQWQQLTPQERKKYQKHLNNWESLTPEEKEILRRKFKKQKR